MTRDEALAILLATRPSIKDKPLDYAWSKLWSQVLISATPLGEHVPYVLAKDITDWLDSISHIKPQPVFFPPPQQPMPMGYDDSLKSDWGSSIQNAYATSWPTTTSTVPDQSVQEYWHRPVPPQQATLKTATQIQQEQEKLYKELYKDIIWAAQPEPPPPPPPPPPKQEEPAPMLAPKPSKRIFS